MKEALYIKQRDQRLNNETPLALINAKIKLLDDLTQETEKALKNNNYQVRKTMERKFLKMPRILEEALKKHKREFLEISNVIKKL